MNIKMATVHSVRGHVSTCFISWCRAGPAQHVARDKHVASATI